MVTRDYFKALFLPLFVTLAVDGFAVTKGDGDQLEVYRKNNDLILMENQKTRRLVAPSWLHNSSRYSVRLKSRYAGEDREGGEGQRDLKDLTVEDKIKARQMVYKANQEFFKGNITKAWELVDQASKINPNDYQLMSMRGSLLYKTGSKDLAIAMWKKSLEINPKQPEVKQLLSKTLKEVSL